MLNGSMSISFHTFQNYPTQFLGKKYNHKTYPCAKPLSIHSSSILAPIDEDNNPQKCIPNMSLGTKDHSDCSVVLNQANTIGIIGGASVHSTLYFLQKLAQSGSKEEKDCPPFLLSSEPNLIYETTSTHFDNKPIIEKLRNKREYLEKGGARCIVIPCHVLHTWHNDISNGCSVPILHMGECVAKELKESKLKPLETGSPLRIGLVATDAILRAGFYQQKLQDQGFEVVLPDKETTEHILLPAMEALNRKDIEGGRNLFRILLQLLLVRAVNMVIIGSNEFRNLLPEDDPLLKKCIDPVDALVKSTIRWAQSVENVHKTMNL